MYTYIYHVLYYSIIMNLTSGKICLLKDSLLVQFIAADVTHITSPRIADVVEWFSKTDLSNVPLSDDKGATRLSILVCHEWVSETIMLAVCLSVCHLNVYCLKQKSVVGNICCTLTTFQLSYKLSHLF